MSTTESTKSWSHTKSFKYHLEHIWRVDDFSILQNKQIAPVSGPEKRKYPIFSAPFSPGGNDQMQFGIRLFPYSQQEEYKNCVGLYLDLLKWQEKDMDIKFTLAILTAKGKVFHTTNVTFTGITGWGWPNFITRDNLLRNASKALPGDVLTIRCEVDVIYGQSLETNQEIIERLQQLSIECAKQHSYNWASLYSTGDLTDVTLEVSGKKFNAHKLVLSAQSSVFKAMFKNNCKEKNEGKVKITDVDPAVFKEFLSYLYTGKVVVGENALLLMKIADKYAIGSLKILCEEYLVSKLTLKTAVPLLVNADMHSAGELKDKAMQFIVRNLTSIGTIQDWDTGLKTRPSLYSEVFRQIAMVPKLD